MFTAIFILCSMLFAAEAIPLLHRVLVVRRTAARARRRNAVVLTFDDGPGAWLTPRILDALAEAKVKATFFILGRNVAGNEHLVRRIAQDGHEVATHGFDHLDYRKCSPWRAIADIRRGCAAIDAALGSKGMTTGFRPPCGKLTLTPLVYLLIRRLPVWYWNIDLGDTWSDGDLLDLVARAKADRLEHGMILMHDFDRSRALANWNVLQATRALIARNGIAGPSILPLSSMQNPAKDEALIPSTLHTPSLDVYVHQPGKGN